MIQRQQRKEDRRRPLRLARKISQYSIISDHRQNTSSTSEIIRILFIVNHADCKVQESRCLHMQADLIIVPVFLLGQVKNHFVSSLRPIFQFPSLHSGGGRWWRWQTWLHCCYLSPQCDVLDFILHFYSRLYPLGRQSNCIMLLPNMNLN